MRRCIAHATALRARPLTTPAPLLPSRTPSCPASTQHHAQLATAMELDPHVQELVSKLHANDTKAVVYVTGGAVQAQSWLLSVPGASNTVLECSVPYARDSLIDILGHEPEQYCSEATAVDMAQAAYRRAAQLTPLGSHIVGVGATCALATVPVKKGQHRAYLACHDGDRGTMVTHITLSKGARSRVGEDALVSMALVQALAQASGIDTTSLSLPLLPPGEPSSPGQPLNPPAPTTPTPNHQPLSSSTNHHQPHQTPSAGALLQGEVPVLSDVTQEGDLLTQSHIPSGDPLEALIQGRVRCVEYARGRVIVDAPRRNKIWLPGSFNPLHKGHIELLQTAARTVGGGRQAAFELSVGNPDKGFLPVEEVRRRVQQFIDADLPVVVTSAPLFTIKARLLPGSCFVVGYDTAVRLVMPKYYENSESNMLVEFATLRQAGCHFLVAGRKDPTTGKFRRLKDVQMHPGLKDLFQALDEFRVDLSSTEIREKSMSPMSD